MKLQLGVSFENQLQLKQLLWIFFFLLYLCVDIHQFKNFQVKKSVLRNVSVLIMVLWGSNTNFLHSMVSLKYSVQLRSTLFFEMSYKKLLKNSVSDSFCSSSDPVYWINFLHSTLFSLSGVGKGLFYVKMKTFSY